MLTEKGVQALVALCAHVLQHGTFDKDGKWIAGLMLTIAGANDEVSEAFDTRSASFRRDVTARMMRAARAALEDKETRRTTT